MRPMLCIGCQQDSPILRTAEARGLRILRKALLSRKKSVPRDVTVSFTAMLRLLTPPQDVCWTVWQSLESSLLVNRGPITILAAHFAPVVIPEGHTGLRRTAGPILWYRVSSFISRHGDFVDAELPVGQRRLPSPLYEGIVCPKTVKMNQKSY